MFFYRSLLLISVAVATLVAANPQPTSLPKVERRYLAKRQDSLDLDSALSQFSDQLSGIDTASVGQDFSSIMNDPEFSSYLSEATQPGFLSSAVSQLSDPGFSSSLAEAVGSSSAADLLSQASAAASSLPKNEEGSNNEGSDGQSDSASKIGAASLTFLGVGVGAAFVFAL